MEPKQIEYELVKLRRAYRNRLYIELSYVVNRTQELIPGPSLVWKLNEIHDRLHKLAGSGGTFGFHQLSQKARQLEITVNAWLSNPEAVDSDAVRHFSAEMSTLPLTVEGDDSFEDFQAPITQTKSQTKPQTRSSSADAPEPDTISRSSTDSSPIATIAGASKPNIISLPGTHSGHGATICLVDLTPQLRLELSGFLATFGHQLICCPDIPSALEICKFGRAPDLFVINIDPLASYLASAHGLKEVQQLRDLGCPTIALSSRNNFSTRLTAARMGASGFFHCPFEALRLIDTLDRVLDSGRPTPYRVLIVDDDIELANLYRLILTQADMEVAILHQPQDIAEGIARFQPELLLLDIEMPECSGLDLATIIRQYDEWTSLPIVYLSAEIDVNKQIAAQSRGADDFLLKPLPASQLIAAVSARIDRSRRLVELMDKDSLTGLLKHSRIKEQVQTEIQRALRGQYALSLVMLDLDHFKRVNDTYGHSTGDQVLKAFSYMLRRRFRNSDSLGRYGGEEFLLLLPNATASSAQEIIEQLRTQFASLEFGQGDQTFSCTFSAGIADLTPGSGITPGSEVTPESGITPSSEITPGSEISVETLIQLADQALYAAKHAGRNRIMIAA